MRTRHTFTACTVGILVSCAALGALPIKLGSLVPAGSPWDLALKRIAAEWGRLSSGSVNVKIYAGGVAGDEPDMLRKVRIGQLNAAMITMSGLQTIYNGVKTLSYPLFLSDDAELTFLLAKMGPFFEEELGKRGFKVILWSPGGWLYFFTRAPVLTPDDLRRQKLWVWGNPDEMQAWQSSGFQVVPLAATDIMTSLQGGMIDGMITSPLLAASNQWFGIAANMADLRLAPLWGALIVSEKTWAEIPEGLRAGLVDSARKITASLGPDLARADTEAISVMRKYGLKVNEVSPQARAEWASVVRRGFDMLIGTAFDRQAYEMAAGFLADFRSGRR